MNSITNNLINQQQLPKYLGIIMDGNGRWAKNQNQPRTYGHKEGINTLVKISDECQRLGIKELDVYAFSCENWNREKSEVDFLMNAFLEGLTKYQNDIISKKIRIKIYGEKTNLSNNIINKISEIETKTSMFKDYTLGICFNYGFKDEIVNMCKTLIKNNTNIDDINKELINNNLYCPNQLDLIIRTGGEYRLSNFMLWQASYAELYFTSTCFPDFDEITKDIPEFENSYEDFARYHIRNPLISDLIQILLMPNPKLGTVTMDVANAVKAAKAGYKPTVNLNASSNWDHRVLPDGDNHNLTVGVSANWNFFNFDFINPCAKKFTTNLT